MSKTKATIYGGGSFEKVATNGSVFLDKSMLIKEVLEDPFEVILITMPRRWGKSCNLEMIKLFLSMQIDAKGEVTDKRKSLAYSIFYGLEGFNALKISQSFIDTTSPKGTVPRKAEEYFGEFPVIYIDLKASKESSIESVKAALRSELRRCFLEHKYLLYSKHLTENQIKKFNRYIDEIAIESLSKDSIRSSLLFLGELLYAHHEKKSVILIDEYDAGLNHAYRNLSEEVAEGILEIIRSIFEATFKSNPYLEKAILTGVQYVGQSGMLSGFNNTIRYNISHYKYSQHYGVTEEEIDHFAKLFQLTDEQLQGAKAWYNGYKLKNKNQYEPRYNVWSIVKYLNDPEKALVSHWEKSGSFDFITTLFKRAEIKEMIESLVSGESQPFDLKLDFSVNDFKTLKKITALEDNQYIEPRGIDVLFSYLFITGYLTIDEQEEGFYKFPNREISHEMGQYVIEHYKTIYRLHLRTLRSLTKMIQSLFRDEAPDPKELLENEFKEQFQHLISAFSLVGREGEEGLFANEDLVHTVLNYICLQTVNTRFATEIYTEKLTSISKGRADILLHNRKRGMIMEVKYQGDSQEALDQAKTYGNLLSDMKDQIYVGITVDVNRKVQLVCDTIHSSL